MSKTKLQSEAEQIAAINSGPAPEEEIIPQVNISGAGKNEAGQIIAAPNYLKGETSNLDSLDQQFLAALQEAITRAGSDVDLKKFDIRSLKEFVGYPGGGYVNWTMVFISHMTRKVHRSDALTAGRVGSRGPYAVLITELESIS